jgi:glycerophosphoryl diester phosphodiesterase
MSATSWPWPRVLAHRCGGTLAPENTLAGLVAAARCGCRGVEFDVMLAADGVPVLIHDETLTRTTNGRGRVADTPWAALRSLDAGGWFGERFAGEPLPCLQQVMTRCIELGLAVNLEIKPAAGFEADTGCSVARAVLAEAHHFTPPPLLSSFSETALQAAAREAPQLPRALLVEHLPADWQIRCRALGVVALHMDHAALDADTVAAVRAAGLWLACYTVNDPARAVALFRWGVDCVITDRPDLIGA